jgi:hypothetical protein
MLGLLGLSVEVVRGRASTHGSHNRTAAPLDRETGPVFKKRKYEIEFN